MVDQYHAQDVVTEPHMVIEEYIEKKNDLTKDHQVIDRGYETEI